MLEILLVLVIISTVLLMIIGYSRQKTESLQIDRTSMQMQAILNAGLAFYLNNSKWPDDIASLQTGNYLPQGTLRSPWGEDYHLSNNPRTGTFSVNTNAPTAGLALVVAGKIPLGAVNDVTVTGTVSIPGQNINNARSVNFSSIYRSGACVPAPKCPTGMLPQIFVAPASVSGLRQTVPSCTNPNDPSSCTYQLLPIHGFRAFAIGDANGKPVNLAQGSISNCDTRNVQAPELCYREMSSYIKEGTRTNPITSGEYWRVCLQVVTEEGVFDPFTPNQPGASGNDVAKLGVNMGNIIAITRCAPQSEPVGSSYNVWSY